jgi:heme exporter protein D
MNWSSWTEFVAMGGYGFYVWGSFGMTAVVIVGELISLRMRRKALRQHSRGGDAAASDFTGSPHEA